jgi:sugar (pentulose or hexulose) kinase
MSSLTAGRLVLGIDLGTSRFKAGLFEPSGKLAGEGGADLTLVETISTWHTRRKFDVRTA